MAALLAPLLLAAEIGGKWDFVWQTGDGERRTVLTLAVTGNSVKVEFPGSKAPLTGSIDGDRVTVSGKLYSPEAGEEGNFRMSGRIAGDTMTGDAEWNEHKLTFRAARSK